MSQPKIALTGAAGLVGQNLVPRLKSRGYRNIVALDKHSANTAILRRLHPDLTVMETDLAHDDDWQAAVADADVVILAHAQIGGLDEAAFTANNVTATERVIAAVRAKACNDGEHDTLAGVRAKRLNHALGHRGP